MTFLVFEVWIFKKKENKKRLDIFKKRFNFEHDSVARSQKERVVFFQFK